MSELIVFYYYHRWNLALLSNRDTLTYNLTDDEYTTILTKDIQVCRRCGVIFDLNIRKNKDCPLCSSGEHTKIRMNDVSDSKSS